MFRNASKTLSVLAMIQRYVVNNFRNIVSVTITVLRKDDYHLWESYTNVILFI